MKTKRIPNIVCVILSCCVIACCSTQNVSRETFFQLPEKYTFSTKENKTLNTFNWWEKFNNEELNEIMDKVFEGNLELKQSIARLKQAEAVEKITKASWFPFVNIGSTASRDKLFSSFSQNLGNTYKWSISAGYEIDLWNKINNRATSSELLKKAGQEDVKASYMLLAARTADLYFFIAEQQNQKKLFDNIVASLKDTKSKVE